MSKILCILFNGAGRILPGIGVIRALREDGHEVALVTVPGEYRPREQLAPQMKALGVRMFPSPEAPKDCHPGAIYPGSQAEEVAALLLKGREETLNLRRQRQIVPVLSQIDPLREIISSYAPDMIVADTLAYQAGIAAHLEKRPYVGYTASLRMVAPARFEFDADSPAMRPEVEALFARFGMSPRLASLEYLSPILNIVFALPELVGNDIPNADLVRLVGSPSMAPRGGEIDFPWDKLQMDRRRLFISFGTVLRWQPEILDMLAAAAEPLDVQCIISAGEVTNTRTFPSHVLAVPYAPQLELLQRVDAFATVGGANSVNEALYAGVPMLVMPIVSDQPVQAYFIETARVGITIPASERTTERFRDALERLLDESQGFKARVDVLKRAYMKTDGARAAAEAIASACRAAAA